MELGIKVLEVPTESIKASLFNHKGSIQAAAHDVLSTWFMGQNSGQEAYVNLLTGLKRAEMSELAAELQYWVTKWQQSQILFDLQRSIGIIFQDHLKL